jgi:hypothetical protein
VSGAFFVGMLSGVRYQQLNDHTFPEKEREEEEAHE